MSDNKELNSFILSLEMLQRNWGDDDYDPVQALVIESLKYAIELKQLRNDVFYLQLDNDSLADELKIALRDKTMTQSKRALEKQKSRDEDARRLEASEITPEELRKENSFFNLESGVRVIDYGSGPKPMRKPFAVTHPNEDAPDGSVILIPERGGYFERQRDMWVPCKRPRT